MKIALIGSTQYQTRFLRAKERLESQGHEVRLPAMDARPDLNELGIMENNRALIEWADEVHMIWDARSIMTIGDWCMAFALRKPVIIEYMEPKRIHNFMEQYHAQCNEMRMRRSVE